MKKIEKTKENIKVDELDERTRKQMFEKFVQAGGKVIQERDKPSTRNTRTIKPATRILRQPQPRPTSREIKQQKIQSDEIFETWLQKKLSRLFIRLRLLFLGVTYFNAEYCKDRKSVV